MGRATDGVRRREARTRRSTRTRCAPTCCGHVAANRISKFAVPEVDRIAFVSEIPKTSVGKINKKLLRERNA